MTVPPTRISTAWTASLRTTASSPPKTMYSPAITERSATVSQSGIPGKSTPKTMAPAYKAAAAAMKTLASSRKALKVLLEPGPYRFSRNSGAV